eukprot:GHVU01100833.1.p2 GENE.GHVU01100833.1~~GHVU01100833.1.p2  ORF type:complete len:136 (-),score=14.33 GHVU01100833.1:866-1273(-)
MNECREQTEIIVKFTYFTFFQNRSHNAWKYTFIILELVAKTNKITCDFLQVLVITSFSFLRILKYCYLLLFFNIKVYFYFFVVETSHIELKYGPKTAQVVGVPGNMSEELLLLFVDDIFCLFIFHNFEMKKTQII